MRKFWREKSAEWHDLHIFYARIMPAHHDCLTQWLRKYVLEHDDRRKLLFDALLGDDRWLAAVPSQDLPKKCRNGAALQSFKHAICVVAFQYLHDYCDAPTPASALPDPAGGGSDSTDTDQEGLPHLTKPTCS